MLALLKGNAPIYPPCIFCFVGGAWIRIYSDLNAFWKRRIIQGSSRKDPWKDPRLSNWEMCSLCDFSQIWRALGTENWGNSARKFVLISQKTWSCFFLARRSNSSKPSWNTVLLPAQNNDGNSSRSNFSLSRTFKKPFVQTFTLKICHFFKYPKHTTLSLRVEIWRTFAIV